MRKCWFISFVLLTVSVFSGPLFCLQVGPATDGHYVIPTRQMLHPAGKSVEFNGRPVDLILSPDGKTVYVKDNSGLVVIDIATRTIRQQTKFPEGSGSAHGLAITRDGSVIYATTSQNHLWEAKATADGKIAWGNKIRLPGPGGRHDRAADLCGIALSNDEKTAYVCLSRNNALAVVDLVNGKLSKEVPVGIAPYDVVLSPDGSTAYVSNWGGRRPKEGEKTSDSSGTQTLVDARGVGCSGTLSVVGLKSGEETAEIRTGLHPSDVKISADGRTVCVANANSDTASVIDVAAGKVREEILVRPDPKLMFGSASNALALSKDGATLYVANGGNNAIAVVALGQNGAKSVIKGFIPTAWYPGAVATDGQSLYIANVKGLGSRFRDPKAKGWGVHSPLGTVSIVEIPSDFVLKQYTAQVRDDCRVPRILRAMERASTGKKPVPVPRKLGEPSVFEHVVYIIKENKTYDQVFGDIGKGNSDPNLCVFGRDSSPNHHALAEQFVLLDNYYCNGVCSADGHAWVTQGEAPSYLEKSFGGWPRSYPYGGNDCLAISSSGLIWDNVLSHGLSFRNYGEMNLTGLPPSTSWADVYKEYLNKTRGIRFIHNINISTLRRYSCPEYPGWNLRIPDVLRADIFLKEFGEFNRTGDWPDFVTIYLPDDHTTGGAQDMPLPKAQMADNDQALGRIVEAISKSRFWPKTCIFVEEDDPQSGFDHVDGHRSLCLVISPYTKRGKVISTFYSQTSVLHTMEQILGIPPMNQMDAMADLMSDCFVSTPDLTPYKCLPNQIPLDAMPSKKEGSAARSDSYSARDGKGDPFAGPDMIDDDKMNRAIWSLAKGDSTPYPVQFAGAHGRGLKQLHLALQQQGPDQ